MRKIFFLIPALILAMMVNATILDIGPTSPKSSDNIRREIRDHINAGDTLRLANGTYIEAETVDVNKNVVIIAAEEATPVVRLAQEAYIKVRSDAKVVIKGITFDGATNSTKYAVRPGDVSDSKIFIEDCEFYGFIRNIITTSEGYHGDSIVIDNCRFHNNIGRACVYFPASNVENQQTCSFVKITNSTFSNNDASADYLSIVDIRSNGLTATDDMEVIVDHCTFYNNLTKNSDYAEVATRIINKTTISNCLFTHGSAQVDVPEGPKNARRATFLYAGTVKNSLTYNLLKDADDHGHTWMTTRINNFTSDPLFADSLNGDFHLSASSPAVMSGTNGTPLGAKEWWPTLTFPTTDLTTPYAFAAADAKLTGEIRLNASSHIEYYDKSVCGQAVWKIHPTKACAVQATLNMESESSSGHIFQVSIFDADGNSIGSAAEQYSEADGNIVLNEGIFIPAAGDYYVVLNNNQSYSSAKIAGITLSYVGGAVQSMPGTTDIDEAWFSAKGTRTAGEKIVIPSGYQHEGWVKWNVSFANTASYKAKVNINGTNGHNYTVALYKDENDLNPITWGEGGQTEHTSPLDLGAKVVPAGDYILKVTNAVQYSNAELISVQFATAGGGLVNIPGDIDFNEAILSSRAYIDENGDIRFTSDAEHGHVTEESVKWRVNVSQAGYYKFTTSVNSNNGHSYLVSVYNADETVLKGSVVQSGDDIWGAPKTFSTDYILLEAGEYRIKVQNTTNSSNGRIVSMSASYEGGAVINIPNNTIPFNQALLYNGATRDLTTNPQEIHFGSVDAYAQWFVQATAGLYTFTFDVEGTDHGKYNLTIIDSQDNTIYNDYKGKDNSGSVEHANILLAAGNYTIKVANINSGSVGYITHITASALENLFILDENQIDNGSIAAVDETSKKLMLKRSFTAGKYYTLCIPLEPGSGERATIFGAGYELWRISTAEQVGEEINLTFEEVPADEFAAGTPYIIKPTQDVENPIFNQHTIHNTTTNNIKYRNAANFIGTFYKDEIPAGENNLYLQNNNLFYSENNNTPIKGTRAWVQLKPQGNNNNVMARIILGGQTATEISLVNGELVNGTVKTIENGQLVIIRDGKKYNVMGIKLQ